MPEPKIATYKLDLESGRYVKQPERISFLKLPVWLKVEETRESKIKINGAESIIHGGYNKGKRFFSGLIEVGSNWFYGNDPRDNKEKPNLCLFHFRDNDLFLDVYYFNGFSKYSRKESIQFCQNYIQSLIWDE